MNQSLIDVVNEKLELILEEAIFDERTESIFKLHYGIQCHRLEPKAISKTLKIPVKKLKDELNRIDNRVFNILKKHQLFAVDED